jgi:hypothetical protein
MRLPVVESELPPEMRGAWHSDIHARPINHFLSVPQLVVAFFKPIAPRLSLSALSVGDSVSSLAGSFRVCAAREAEESSEVVLETRAPSLRACLGLSLVPRSTAGWTLSAFNSVYPDSRVGKLYFRAIEPFHHVGVELLLWLAARRHPATGATS